MPRDKFIYISMNQPTLNKSHDLKDCFCFTKKMKFDENKLMNIEDRWLAEESIRDWLLENYYPDVDFSEILSKIQQTQGEMDRDIVFSWN